MTRVLLGLGSNLGNRVEHLGGAVRSLRALGELAAVSQLYETEPVGGPEQGAFLNCVVELDTDRGPRALLALCHDLEAAAGRERAERWGPRTLDVDILWIDGVTVDEPDLRVPHPRMRDRAFVMVPLAEIAPDVAGDGWAEMAAGEVALIGPLVGR